VNDKTTTLMERDRLSDLIHATVDPATGVSAHTVPRTLVDSALRGRPAADRGVVSPVAVLFVLAVLVVLFVSIVRL
jgi:hypothetical protein